MKWYVLLTFVLLITSGSSLSLNWMFFWRENLLAPRASCNINIQEDLSSASPLLLRSNVTAKGNLERNANDAYYLPNDYGEITFLEDAVINLSCPNAKVLLNGKSTGESIVPVRCSGSGNTFEMISTKVKANLYEFSCSAQGQIARYTNKTCLNGLKEIEIGFPVSSNVFLREILVCFDPVAENTAYSVYNLTSAIRGSQYSTPRPDFVEGNFYSIGVNSLYFANNERKNINRQLGLDQSSKKYIGNGDYYLSRGHLTAKADFVYGNQHNATFFYVNAAPQWQVFNGGNWNDLEISVRRLAEDRYLNLEVYSGTHGLLTLPHETTGKETALYLYHNSNNGKHAIPVPRMYWKIAYDPKTQAGIAFVGLNNPYNTDIDQEILCKDICDQVKFKLFWDRTNIDLGYGYCCDVNELRKVVTNIPKFTVKTVLL